MNIIIFGATGWLGKNTIDFFKTKFKNQCNLTLVSSKIYNIEYKNEKFTTLNTEQFKKIKNHQFDYYFDFAFLTGNFVNNLKQEVYIARTNELINSSNNFLNKNDVDKALLASSGAVYWNGTLNQNVYSLQKSYQEEKFIETSKKNNVKYSVARIFALFANYYNVNFKYAFSDFIIQAKKSNKIVINSKLKVIRSYLFVNFLLEYFLKSDDEIYDAWNLNLDIYEIANCVSKYFDNCYVEVDDFYLKNEAKNEYISLDYTFQKKIPNFNYEEEINKIIDFTENDINQIKFNTL